ncbi:hypothetical protein M127_3485 [Bacteroides fragilis str. S6L5]|uniref:Uncharacterized protein n=1 Tax=Bacteroides fragilis str. S36L11 TaxID=1339327 RepID=A0A016AFX1_BACFG|nr:hypothetical protein M136_3484 [Bacteroides fragilis str. S36L11]EYE44829.1 hypothetical protein M127_3485 [Bacteroides fragilis str. S6L5]
MQTNFRLPKIIYKIFGGNTREKSQAAIEQRSMTSPVFFYCTQACKIGFILLSRFVYPKR